MAGEFVYIGAGLLVIVLVVVCVLVFRRNNDEEEIDTMSGTEFEDFMAEILHRSGVEVLELTKASGDFGADIIVMHEGERTAVQCKRYSRPIGVKAVQEAISAKDYYKCSKAAVITNSTFTRQAMELAAESGVILWDRDAVYGFMAAAQDKSVRKTCGTLRFSRLESGKLSDEELVVYINNSIYTIPPHKSTVISVPSGKCRIFIKQGIKKNGFTIDLSEETRNFAVGYYKNKPFLEEIC